MVAAQVHISLAPLAALSRVVTLQTYRPVDDTALLFAVNTGGCILFVATLVLALGWLITPAINGLLRSCAEPV